MSVVWTSLPRCTMLLPAILVSRPIIRHFANDAKFMMYDIPSVEMWWHPGRPLVKR